MKQFEGQDILNFIKELPNDDACKAYLAKINWHIQAYFDEFCFRINRSQFKTSIFHKTICRIVEGKLNISKSIKTKIKHIAQECLLACSCVVGVCHCYIFSAKLKSILLLYLTQELTNYK